MRFFSAFVAVQAPRTLLIPPRHARQFSLGVLACLLAGAPVMAGEITASGGALGLGTAVNGQLGGGCGAGLCLVGGGTAAGRNLFHRFSAFDTRGGITGVNFATGGRPNVFVGVTSPLGSFIDKQVSFSGPTNLFWLSPGGISVSGAGGFANIQQLKLSTATGWRLGNGVFDAAGTTAGQAALLNGPPLTGLAGAVNDPASLAALGLQKNGDLSLFEGLLTVDQALLLDAQGGHVLLQGGRLVAADTITLHGDGVTLKQSLLDVSNAAGAAGDLVVQGRTIALAGTTLQANGREAGGQIFVGGGLRGNDPAILNATTVRIDANSKLSADATSSGDGGTIVVHALDSASVAGQFTARGGALSGQGGLIETSAPRLDFSGLAQVDTHAASGRNGTWLIDPTNFSIVSSGTAANTITAALLQSNLALNNVLIETSSTGSQDGDITVAAPVTWNANRLTLSAHRNINVNEDLVANGTGSLSFYYGQGFLDGFGATYAVAPGASVEVPLGQTSFLWKKGSAGLESPVVLDNGLIRFWQSADFNTSNSLDRYSFNGAGVLQQPAYLNGNTWYKLTYSDRPLEFALGIGGDGSANWNTNGTILTSGDSTSYQSSSFSSLGITRARMDVSRYLEGVGTVVTKVDLSPSSLSGTELRLTNQYNLVAGASSVRVNAAIANRSTAPLTNLRYWYGTGDDHLGGSDTPTKTRGNLGETGFVPLSNALDPSNSIKVEANGQAVIFYSPSPGTATTTSQCCSFSNAFNQNPAAAPVTLANDGSYAIYLRYPFVVAPADTIGASFLFIPGAVDPRPPDPPPRPEPPRPLIPVTTLPPPPTLPPIVAPPPTLPPIVAPQQSINPIRLSFVNPITDYTAPGSPLAAQWVGVGVDTLSINLTESAFLYYNSFLLSDTAVRAGGLSTQPVEQLSPQQVSAQFNAAEQKAMEVTAAKLGLDPGGLGAPTPAELQASLRQVVEAVRRRRTLAVTSSLPSPLPAPTP